MSDEHDQHDDLIESRLRRALNSEAAMVQPTGDGLQKIRGSIDERRGTRWRTPVIALAAAALLGLAVGAVIFGLGDDDKTNTLPANDGSSSATTSAPSSPTPSESSPSPSETANGAAVYVYYIAADGSGLRLYREQHAGVGTGPAPEAALRVMFGGQPDDHDYKSPWDDTELLSYRVDADTATVNVSKFVGLGGDFESAAVQEIVYTVTANDPAVKKVRLRVKGKTPPSGHIDWSGPIQRARMVDVQGLIWILAPTQDAKVGSPVKIDGYGTANEGTISWEVRERGTVVKEGNTQGGSMGEFGEFHDTVTLPPGDYELTAFEASAKDGSPIHIDTKNFTVR